MTSAVATEVQPIDVCYFGLFDNCNVKCNMCDCWQRPRARLGTDHYQRVLARVLEAKPGMIRFTGGEPMLLPGLTELVAQAHASGAEVSVITNGRIAAKKIMALRDAGLDLLVVSLDGAAEAHEAIRGVDGLFGKVRNTLEVCVSAGVPYAINTVIQEKSCASLPQLARFLAERTPPAYWHMIPVRGNDHLAPSGPSREEAVLLAREAAEIARVAGVEVVYDPGLSFALEAPARCTVPQRVIYVRADSGECYACNMLAYATAPIGNILNAPLANIWGGEAHSRLAAACASAEESGCARCDAGSRAMNHWLAQDRGKRPY